MHRVYTVIHTQMPHRNTDTPTSMHRISFRSVFCLPSFHYACGYILYCSQWKNIMSINAVISWMRLFKYLRSVPFMQLLIGTVQLAMGKD